MLKGIAPVRVLSKDERDSLRNTRAFKQRNTLWATGKVPGTTMGFNAFQRVGKMADIIAKAQPESFDDFKRFYLDNIRSWEEIQAQAMEWYDFIASKGLPISREEALAEHIIHVFDQTWEGWEREEEAAKIIAYLTNSRISRPSWRWDSDYAIDLVAGEGDDFIEGYQIKPRSFFLSQRDGVRWARQANAKKHRMAEAKGKRVYFVDADELERGYLNLIHWSQLN